VSFFVKRPKNLLESVLMNIGFGLGAFALLSVILNLFRIQLHWMVFLVISLAIPVFMMYRYVSRHGIDFRFPDKLKIKKSTMYILFVLLLFAIFFAVYHKGAFVYPYLEDDDPWLHASAAKYIATYRTFSHDPSVQMSYIEPYPPSYAVLMGVLHQTNTNIIWNLKFFNVLIISLGLIFFYFFAKEFFASKRKALFAAFLLALIPCFMSHFIWASSLAIVLFFPALYAAERIRHDSRWWIVAAVMIAGIMVAQPSNSAIFGLMFIMYWIIKALMTRSLQRHVFLAGLVGLALSFAFFFVPMMVKYGEAGFAGGLGYDAASLLHFSSAESGGGLLYTWQDFIVAKGQSKMDNPVGVGIFLFFLVALSLLYVLYIVFRRPKKFFSAANAPYLIMVVWLLFAFAGVHGNRLPVQLMPHRFWAIFAIPAVLIAVEGFFALGRLFERFKVPRFFVYAVIIIGIIITSGYPKYQVETSHWPPGVNWGSMDELRGYFTYVEPLPHNTKVLPLCSHDFKALAFDKYAEPWDPEYVRFKESAFNMSAEKIASWMKSRGYEYITMDAYCLRKHDLNSTSDKMQDIINSSRFVGAGAVQNSFYMFRVM
jgi:hypothetical protein